MIFLTVLKMVRTDTFSNLNQFLSVRFKIYSAYFLLITQLLFPQNLEKFHRAVLKYGKRAALGQPCFEDML
jgi:hypothetical protein